MKKLSSPSMEKLANDVVSAILIKLGYTPPKSTTPGPLQSNQQQYPTMTAPLQKGPMQMPQAKPQEAPKLAPGPLQDTYKKPMTPGGSKDEFENVIGGVYGKGGGGRTQTSNWSQALSMGKGGLKEAPSPAAPGPMAPPTVGAQAKTPSLTPAKPMATMEGRMK